MGTPVQPVDRDEYWKQEEIRLKQFSGGQSRGLCVQVTAREKDVGWQFVTLTKSEAKRLAHRLIEWADGHAMVHEGYEE